MSSLFPEDELLDNDLAVPGLLYVREYLNAAEELQLVSCIESETWDLTWKRRRQLYGATYAHDKSQVSPIPSWGRELADRIYHRGISNRPFDQMLVNEYLPGQGISFHRDYERFDRTVVSLSVLSPCVMDFRSVEDQLRLSLLLEPRSLLVLADEARYDWEHAIAPRKTDRWREKIIRRGRRLSITFRNRKQD